MTTRNRKTLTVCWRRGLPDWTPKNSTRNSTGSCSTGLNGRLLKGKFPTDKNRSLDPEEHVIRLITRLLFVWFIKEKGLVADELLNEARISPLLKDYDRDAGNSYYRAVLQNLFFATLNTEIGKRKFSEGGNPRHRNFSLYRYKDQITDPDKLLELFEKTPFINGGLFDCLDSEEATRDGGYRIDCFSDVDYDKLRVPNRLFFDKDRGLIPLLRTLQVHRRGKYTDRTGGRVRSGTARQGV